MTVLEAGWAKGLEVSEQLEMHFLLPTFWVVAEQAGDHASRCHRMNLCFVGSK